MVKTGVAKSRPRVLVVDDEPENVELAKRTLASEFNVVTFTVPEEALAAIESERIDLILADQRMPRLTGVELLKRARLCQPNARRVILSGYTDAPALMAAINEGQIHRYLTKPFEPMELRACVRALTAGCVPGEGRWLVVDGDRERGRGIAEILGNVGGSSEIEIVTKVAPTPDLGLVVMVQPTPAEVEQVVVRQLGGPGSRVILMVALSADRGVKEVDYLRAGADEVVSLPLSAIEFSLRYHMLGARRLAESRSESLRAELFVQQGSFQIIGRSPAMQKMRAAIASASLSDGHVLLVGEAGTGKGVVARALHAASLRCTGPFVAMDLLRLAPEAMEGELFGTDSADAGNSKAAGRLRNAAGGTLFLKGIDRLPLAAQRRLVEAFLQAAPTALPRIVATAHGDLQGAVRDQGFVRELQQLVSATQINVPPLRERVADIRPLATSLLERIRRRHGTSRPTRFSDAALQELETYPWPGNCTELEQLVERAVTLGSSAEEIGPGLLTKRSIEPLLMRVADEFLAGDTALPGLLTAVEKAVIAAARDRYGDNLGAMAAKLGLPEKELRGRLARA